MTSRRAAMVIPSDSTKAGQMSLRATHGNLESGRTKALSFRLIASVLAGTIAIALNMALLSFASAAGISTSHGGLFRLFTSIISRLVWSLRLIDGRSNLPLSSQAFLRVSASWRNRRWARHREISKVSPGEVEALFK